MSEGEAGIVSSQYQTGVEDSNAARETERNAFPQLTGWKQNHIEPVSTLCLKDTSDAELVTQVRQKVEEVTNNGQAGEIRNIGKAPLDEWALVTRRLLTETDLTSTYAEITGIPPVAEEEFNDVVAYPEASYEFLLQKGCVPLRWTPDYTVLAIYHPYNLGELAFQWQAVFNTQVAVVLGRRTLIEHVLTSLYDVGAEAEDEISAIGEEANEEALRGLASEAPVVRLVNDMFSRAIDMGASDIHVEPTEDQLYIRFRIDGILRNVLNPPLGHYHAIASRLKLLAGMNIAERRRPQDGRLDWNAGQTEFDVRVSTLPSVHGESVVMRLLAKDTSIFDIERLGLPKDTKESFRRLITFPYGMLLVVGPTGSGKTTTLYSAMKLLNSESSKVITIEDPVEYQIKGLTQIQVMPQIGLTFANGLRSIVRQDPDIILVGEIRDTETAEIAIHAALTGHLVFSTLHTNNAAGAVSRLLEMELESFLISSALLGVLSQRLIRRYCTVCNGNGIVEENNRCHQCLGRGYHGRTGIFELLTVTEEIRKAINERKNSDEIERIARDKGMRTLRDDGQRKIDEGVTSLEEVERVSQLDVEE